MKMVKLINFPPGLFAGCHRCPNFTAAAPGGDLFKRTYMARVSTGKAQRFRIFSRDGFTCRYCGRRSDVIPLHLDHLIPVSRGGTNDDDNLITSCRDCNLGKGSRRIEESELPESGRLALAQERNEQMVNAEAAQKASRARSELRSVLVDYFCDARGQTSCDSSTVSVLFAYVNEHGADQVFQWIDSAASKMQGRSDKDVGNYISGIRRTMQKKGAL